MPRLSVSRRTTAEPDTVWELLTSTRHWPSWGLTVRDHHGPPVIGLGSSGRVVTVGGLGLPYRVTHFVDRRSWSWSVAGVAATSHDIAVDEDRRGRRVTVRFGAPWWAVAYLPVLWWSLRSLVTIAERGPDDRSSKGIAAE